jgi:hypothetical protein
MVVHQFFMKVAVSTFPPRRDGCHRGILSRLSGPGVRRRPAGAVLALATPAAFEVGRQPPEELRRRFPARRDRLASHPEWQQATRQSKRPRPCCRPTGVAAGALRPRARQGGEKHNTFPINRLQLDARPGTMLGRRKKGD